MLISALAIIAGIAVAWVMWEYRPSRRSRAFVLLLSIVWVAGFVWDSHKASSEMERLTAMLQIFMGMKPAPPQNLIAEPLEGRRPFAFFTDADASKISPKFRNQF